MITPSAAVQAFGAGGNAQRIQCTRGKVAGRYINGAVEEGEQAGQLRKAVHPSAVMEVDLAPIPATSGQFAKDLFAVVILAPGIQVEVSGDEDVSVLQQSRLLFIGVSDKHIEKRVNPTLHVGAVQVQTSQVKSKAVAHLNGCHLGGKVPVAGVALSFRLLVALVVSRFTAQDAPGTDLDRDAIKLGAFIGEDGVILAQQSADLGMLGILAGVFQAADAFLVDHDVRLQFADAAHDAPFHVAVDQLVLIVRFKILDLGIAEIGA